MKKQTCKFILEDGSTCGSIFHTAMYHKPKKAIKRKPIKRPVFGYTPDPFKGIVTVEVNPKKPRKKRTDRAKLKKTLEVLVKDFVKERDNYTCQRCGKRVEGTNCHASHVIPVSRSGNMAFDPLNMKVLCYHDHINWWHKHPVESGQWFRDTFPERWEYLEKRYATAPVPKKVWELEEEIAYFKGLLK